MDQNATDSPSSSTPDKVEENTDCVDTDLSKTAINQQRIILSQRQSYRCLRNVNNILKQLDNELIKYKKLEKPGCCHFYTYKDTQEDFADERHYLEREIKNELRLFHYFIKFPIKFLCEELAYTEEITHTD